MPRRNRMTDIPTLPHETYQDRAYLCEATVSIDGYPARITGYMNDFAMVRARDNGISAEFAWETVARIVAKGGSFNS